MNTANWEGLCNTDVDTAGATKKEEMVVKENIKKKVKLMYVKDFGGGFRKKVVKKRKSNKKTSDNGPAEVVSAPMLLAASSNHRGQKLAISNSANNNSSAIVCYGLKVENSDISRINLKQWKLLEGVKGDKLLKAIEALGVTNEDGKNKVLKKIEKFYKASKENSLGLE